MQICAIFGMCINLVLLETNKKLAPSCVSMTEKLNKYAANAVKLSRI